MSPVIYTIGNKNRQIKSQRVDKLFYTLAFLMDERRIGNVQHLKEPPDLMISEKSTSMTVYP
ncbi:hypothetical protein QF033_001197 [Bacillus pumilus]|nr:hypothetical protein [Bacillus pumilus]